MDYQRINEYLTSIFNNVLVIEEVSLRGSRFKDISIKEMHTIDVIGKFPDVPHVDHVLNECVQCNPCVRDYSN